MNVFVFISGMILSCVVFYLIIRVNNEIWWVLEEIINVLVVVM